MNLIEQNETTTTTTIEKDYRSLMRLSVLLNTQNELDYLLELIVKEYKEILEADRVSLFLVDEPAEEIYSVVTLGLEGEEIRFSLGRGIAGTVALTGEVINIDDAQDDPRFGNDLFDYVTRSLLTVPLRTNTGKIIGVVQAFNKKEGVFERRDVEILSALCDLAAVAIERARTLKEQQRLSDQLIYQAHHDALTGLPNRLLLEETLEQTLSEAEKKGHSAAVLFIDLDRFKLINDSLGHSFGDKLLQQVAHRLQGVLRYGDFVARQGGDEFVVVLKVIRNELSARKVTDNILKVLQNPFYVDGQELFISASIGICLYPQHGQSVMEILRHADIAMYKVKDCGKNNYQLFETEMSEAENRRLWLVTELHKALEYEELMLFYQPQQDLTTGQMIGAEALIRWKHPELGLVSPGEFIPVAEETGLIIPVGSWVLNEACRKAREWQLKGLPSFRISVNVSALQFGRDNFVDLVVKALEDSQLDPRFLELELTEGLLFGDTRQIITKLSQLKAMGITLAIDDFGTGYSSLSYLQQLPIDTLKIDQSFVKRYGLETSSKEKAKNGALLKTITTMAQNLGLGVIAEGVETEFQQDYLKEIGCQEIQGYLYSRPLDKDGFEKFLARQSELVPLSSLEQNSAVSSHS